MGSAATFEGAISDPLLAPSDEQVGVDDGIEVDQLADGLPDELTDSEPESGDPYAGLTPAEIRAKIAEEVKVEVERDAEARKAQALKDQRASLENEQRQQARVQAELAEIQRAQWANTQQGRAQIKQALTQYFKQAVDSDDGFNPDALDGITEQIYKGVQFRHFADDVATPIQRVVRAFGQDFTIHPSFLEEWNAGLRTRNTELLTRALTGSVSQLAFQKGIEYAKAEMTKEAAGEAKAAEEARALQAERKRAAGSVQPTNARGSATKAQNHREILDTTKPGTKAYADAYEAVYGIRPPVHFK